MSTNERSVSQLEGELYANGALLAGSGAAKALDKLKKARAHLAFLRLAAAAPAMGFNVAEPDKEMAGMTREQVAALAKEAMAYLESLLPAK
jgi:hypothetical protein